MNYPPLDFGDDDLTPPQDDPRFDAWIARQAPNVNPPPTTPREAMWEAIQAARPVVYTVAPTPTHVLPFRRRRWHVPAMIAAALLVGIGIERVMLTRGGTTSSPAGERQVASSTTTTTVAPPAPSSSSTVGAAPSSAPSSEPTPSRRVAEAPSAPRTRGTRESAAVAGATDTAGVARLYRLAAEQTFTQAEALLTAYRATNVAARDSVAARQLGTWGRDVLSSTRLLLDSPAGADPQLHALLNDLELVLVQIVRLSGTPLDATDRAVIDRALHGSDLLPRLRTAVPAGVASTTSDE